MIPKSPDTRHPRGDDPPLLTKREAAVLARIWDRIAADEQAQLSQLQQQQLPNAANERRG